MGTINWMGDHLPHLAGIMAPISALMGKAPFVWGPEQEAAFVKLEAMVPLVLTPIDWSKIESSEHHLYVFGDASITGIGSCLSSGPTKETARPFRVHSAKFNKAQINYDTTNQELLAIVEGYKTFEQHLIGWPSVAVTDHQALVPYISSLPHLTRRHVRMATELSRFDFTIEFIEGKKNVLADALSRLYETEDAVAAPEDYVYEPDLDEFFPDSAKLAGSAEFLLFSARFELDAASLVPRIREAVRTQDQATLSAIASLQASRAEDHRSLTALASFAPLATDDELLKLDPNHDPLNLLGPLQPGAVKEPSSPASTLSLEMPSRFMDALPAAFKADPRFSEILENGASWPQFVLREDLVFHRSLDDSLRLCVPRGHVLIDKDDDDGAKLPTLREFLLATTHEVLAHAGSDLTLSHLRRSFWWEKMTKDTQDFCRSCEPCARGKPTTQKPFGRLHPLLIPTRPWQVAGMNFMTGLPARTAPFAYGEEGREAGR